MPPRPPSAHLGQTDKFIRLAAAAFREELAEGVAHGCCYAVLHVAQALLAIQAISATTHKGVGQMLSLHFVRHGPLPSHFGRVFNKIMGDRELADYGVGDDFDMVAARELVALTGEFVRAAVPLISADDVSLKASAILTHLAILETYAR